MLKDNIHIEQPEKIVERIASFIKENLKEFNRDGAILGISGGIDSALSAFLATRAIGREKVLGVFLGERDSQKQSQQDAEIVANKLGIRLIKVNITKILSDIGIYKLEPSTFLIPRKIQERYVLDKYNLLTKSAGYSGTKNLQTNKENAFLMSLIGGGSEELKRGNAFFRAKHRVRMVMWYYYAELYNYLVIGCCYKTEKLTGYFIKYGDSGSDVDVISPLYKTQVRQLAAYVGIPQRIIDKAPSPDIMPGMTDEFALQMEYEKLDLILYGVEHGVEKDLIKNEAHVTEQDIDYVKTLVKLSKQMRELPPSPQIADLLR